jgi:hypothetical protein
LIPETIRLYSVSLIGSVSFTHITDKQAKRRDIRKMGDGFLEKPRNKIQISGDKNQIEIMTQK